MVECQNRTMWRGRKTKEQIRRLYCGVRTRSTEGNCCHLIYLICGFSKKANSTKNSMSGLWKHWKKELMTLEVNDVCDGENCSHEAAIGKAHYDTLQEAVHAADGKRVTLLQLLSWHFSFLQWIFFKLGIDIFIK